MEAGLSEMERRGGAAVEGATQHEGSVPGGSEPVHHSVPRLYYGWIIIAIAFCTMALSVTARTAFSLFLPPLLEEFAWDRADTAGAFSFGFLCSALMSPLAGRVMDRRGPRVVIAGGALMMTAGLLLATRVSSLVELYLSLGLLVGAGANLMSYSAQSQYLPNWFVRQRGLAISLAFSGVGVGAITLLPWLQTVIVESGWREACLWLAAMLGFTIIPLSAFVRRRPQDVGQWPDGDAPGEHAGAVRRSAAVVDPQWVARTWTLAAAVRTARFWWICLGFFSALVAWYAVQVHQTRYLTEIGFTPSEAAWALGLVSVVGIPGQILLGAWSDRIGREIVWAIGCAGFAICYGCLLALEHAPWHSLLVVMVVAQGFLGYSLTSVMGAIVAEIFEGPHFAAIFGLINVAILGGGAFGPWVAGVLHDASGNYRAAFWLCLLLSLVSAFAIYKAAPRQIRRVGRFRPATGGPGSPSSI